jgi:2-hydroxychromene-2-carboxylate isomerase
MPRLEFWFEFASTYSYLSVMRVDRVAEAAGVAIDWRPFLLGPIFKSQGWTTSPFNLFPAKGRYMVRDIQRIAASRGLPFRMPPTFPANGLMAARLATLGMGEGWGERFSREVFAAQFGMSQDIGDAGTLSSIMTSIGLDPADTLHRASQPPIKEALRAATESAMALGIFGAPTFVSPDGELFWGDDRLEQAIAWAQSRYTATGAAM